MARKDYYFSRRAGGGGFVRRPTRQGVDYSKFATEQWAILLSFFRWYPDILEDIFVGDNAKYTNSLMNRVTKRYMARYNETFTYACRGYGKTTCIVSDKCNKGILWPGEITAYYAPVESQAAPLATKAFADYETNTPLLAQHWDRISQAREHFEVRTKNGSRFLMDIDRGLDTSGVVAEECGQEDKNPFNFAEFNQVVLGTNRLDYKVNGVSDPNHLDSQIHYITSASRKENEAFSVCKGIRKAMQNGESAYALFIPWQVPVLCRMKKLSYYRMLKKKLTSEQFMRECESHCTGSVDNPLIKDSVLEESRTLMCMEDRYFGHDDDFYILGYDVSSRDHAGNALSAMSVIKCERQYDTSKWDHYRKKLVYVMDMAPPASAREHAKFIKKRWKDYCSKDMSHVAFLIIDARSYGQSVIEALHEDLGDGLPPLKTMNDHDTFAKLERPGALPVVYAIQATGAGGHDPNSEMLDYIEREYENGNLTMLTANILEGTQNYKLRHKIKDASQDAKIQLPYIKTRELVRQIQNLKKQYNSIGWTEKAISQYIPKDMWSATLYANRLAQRREHEELYALNRSKNEWEEEAERMGIDNAGLSEYTVHPRGVRRMGRTAIND